jgi:hypothetical protein
MRQIRVFQILVVLSTLTYLSWFFFPNVLEYFANSTYLEIQYRLGRYNGFGAFLPVHHPLYYGTWFGLSLLASIGVFFFQNWGRHLLLSLYALGVLLSLLSGFSVQGPVENFLGQLTVVLDGAVLAMAYFSPLAKHFSPNPAFNPDARKRRAG